MSVCKKKKKEREKVRKHIIQCYLKDDGCVGEAEREREGESLGRFFMALPASSREVTLGEIQDKSFCAD